MSLFPSLLTGFTLVLGCTTRSVPTEYPADSALSAAAPNAVPTSPASLADERFVVSNASDGSAKRAHSEHDHSGHDHSTHRGNEEGRSAAVGAGSAEPSSDDGSARVPKYACPMHPEETSPKPGQCPVCGMNLERVK